MGTAADNVQVYGYDRQNPQRQPRGLKSTLYNPVRGDFPEMEDLVQQLKEVDGNLMLVHVFDRSETTMVQTKFGKFPKGSPLAVQQKMSSQFLLNIMDAEEFPKLPVRNVMEHQMMVTYDEETQDQINSIEVDLSESHDIEKMTRLQTQEPRWHAVRKDRLTASIAGDIVKRRAGKVILLLSRFSL